MVLTSFEKFSSSGVRQVASSSFSSKTIDECSSTLSLHLHPSITALMTRSDMAYSEKKQSDSVTATLLSNEEQYGDCKWAVRDEDSARASHRSKSWRLPILIHSSIFILSLVIAILISRTNILFPQSPPLNLGPISAKRRSGIAVSPDHADA